MGSRSDFIFMYEFEDEIMSKLDLVLREVMPAIA